MTSKVAFSLFVILLSIFNSRPHPAQAESLEKTKELIGIWSGKCYAHIWTMDVTLDVISSSPDGKLDIIYTRRGGQDTGAEIRTVAHFTEVAGKPCLSFTASNGNELRFCKDGDHLFGNTISPNPRYQQSNYRCSKLVASSSHRIEDRAPNTAQVAPASIAPEGKPIPPEAAVNTGAIPQVVVTSNKRAEDYTPPKASEPSVKPQVDSKGSIPEAKPIPPVSVERRVALVVGNNQYAEVPLRNTIHDAEDLSKLLKQFGFNVITRTNVNQRQMEDAVNDFYRLIRGSDVALFYYSGHGTQVQGENYLIPVGENIQSESDVRYKAVNAGYVLGKMEEAKTPTNIMILDACRNNPFKGYRSASRGLTMMQAPQGTFVAYATAPNSVAQDGTGRNGVYTKHLLQEIPARGVPIELVFKKVLAGVQNETGGQQTPWVSTSLKGDFFFNP